MNSNKPNALIICLPVIAGLMTFSVQAATTVDPDNHPSRTIAGYALKSTDIVAGATKAYRPWFDNTSWQGDLIEYVISAAGIRSTDVNFSADPPTTAGTNWSARIAFAGAVSNDSSYWTSTRKIITSTTGSDQIAFRWNTLGTTLQQALDPAGDLTLPQNDILDYIRGDRSKEGLGLRTRKSILGDIIHSNPIYVGKPTGDFTFSGYPAFKDTARDGRIYVGANDGMLHVFDEINGSEVYAYIPSMLIQKLKQLTSDSYTHSYYVDGQFRSGDAYIDTDWKTILAGGMGAGASGFFVLDITNPNLSSESANTGADKKILWEKTDNDLGHIHGAPSIVQLPDSNWYVATGNGYASANGDAKLYLLNLSNGNITTMTAELGTDNGLSEATFVDVNRDYKVDYAYAGDLKGNLWRFDLSDLSSSPTKLFSAGVDKPITVAPDLTFHPNGNLLVYFGTGSLLSNIDLDDINQQSVYAIWDQFSGITDTCRSGGSGDLLCQTLTPAVHSTNSVNVRIASQSQPNWSEHKGWRVDLPDLGERLLGRPQLRGGRLELISTNPTLPKVENWLMNFDYLSGGDADNILFDLSGNNTLDSADKVTVSGAARTPVAVDLGLGYLSQPNIARLNNGIDLLLINGLTVDKGTSGCSGNCSGGILGGHVDVDTDIELGDATDHHTHEYDDKHNITYMDYFDLKDGGDLLTDASIGIDAANQKLIAVISNADLSPGGILTIGAKQWNVVEYQKMIQQKLEAWDGVSALLDNDGDPLDFTLNQVNSAVGGTGSVRISFNDQAIITGGLVPTQTGCVRGSSELTNGRWRNGALTLHVLDLASIDVNATVKAYTIQNPPDLVPSIDLASGTVTLIDAGVNYGGVRANINNPAAFLYESTLFWHYSGDCYGDSDWETDRANSIISATTGQLATFLADLNTVAATELAALENHVCTDFDTKNNVCKDSVYEGLIGALENHISTLLPDYIGDYGELAVALSNMTSGGSVTSVAASPPTDVSLDFKPVLGPKPPAGRVSWIDLRR